MAVQPGASREPAREEHQPISEGKTGSSQLPLDPAFPEAADILTLTHNVLVIAGLGLTQF